MEYDVLAYLFLHPEELPKLSHLEKQGKEKFDTIVKNLELSKR